MAGSNTVVARVGLDDSGFQEGVQKIQRSLKLVQSEFAAASSKLGDFSKSSEGLSLKADSLNKQMELQKAKVAALTKSYQESAEKKGEDAKATENLKIKLNYAVAEMNKLENELTTLNREIEVQSSGFTKLGNNLTGIGSNMKNAGDNFSKVGSTLNKTVTLPIAAAGAGLFKLASDFDEASDSIRIGTGATGEALKNLEKDFKSVYGSVDTSIADASKVIADLNTRTGLTGNSLQELSTQMLRLAKITGEDINTLIPASTRMFQDAGLSAEDYGKALDYTFKVSQSTGIGVGRLQQLMTQFGGPLRQMGFDWQTSAAMLGKFEKEGVNTELVVGSLRIALGKMATEGISEPNKALAEMIERIKAAGTAGQANALALEMFGSRAGPDMASAIREGRLNLDELINSLKSSPETIAQVYNDTADAAEQFTILKNKMALSLEPLGNKLFTAVNNAMPAIENLIQGISGIIEKFNALIPAQQEMILKLALLAAAIGPVATVIGKVISVGGTLFSTLGSISTALGAAGGAGAALSAAFAFLTGPIGLVVAAIAGLTAVFVVLYKYHEQLIDIVINTWNQIMAVIKNITGAVKDLIKGFIDQVINSWKSYGSNLISISKTTFDNINSTVKTVLNTVLNIVKSVLGEIKANWQTSFENVKGLTSNAWVGIKSITQSGTSFIKSLISTDFSYIQSLMSGIWSSVKSLTASAWQGIKTSIETPVNAAKNTVRNAIDAIYSFFANLRLPEIRIPKIKMPHFSIKGSFSIDPPRVPRFNVDWYAKGGIFNRPSIIGVGEAGTEAVLPIDRLDELIAKALEKANVNSTNAGITLNIESFINNSEKDIEKLAYELEFYRQRAAMGRGG